nr:MAG TPA: hypothetical protein [Caudoviricetes sp.]
MNESTQPFSTRYSIMYIASFCEFMFRLLIL